MEETPATPATADLMEGLDNLAHHDQDHDFLDFVSFLDSHGTESRPSNNQGQGQNVSGWGQSSSLQTPEFPFGNEGIQMGVGFGSLIGSTDRFYQQQCSSTSQDSTQTQLVQEFDTIVSDLENFGVPGGPQHDTGNFVELTTVDFDCLRDGERAAFPIGGDGSVVGDSHKKEKVHEIPRGPFGDISQDENRLGLVSTHVGGRPDHLQGTFRGHQTVTSTWVAQQSVASTTPYGFPHGMNPDTTQMNPSFGNFAAASKTLPPQTLIIPVGGGLLHNIIPATATASHFQGPMSYGTYGNGGVFQSNVANSEFSASTMISMSSSSGVFQGPFQQPGGYALVPGMSQEVPHALPVQGRDLTSTQILVDENSLGPLQLQQAPPIFQGLVETVETSRTSVKEATPTLNQPSGKAGRFVLGSPIKKPNASLSINSPQKSKKGQKSKASFKGDSPPKSKVPKASGPKVSPQKSKKSPKKKEYFARAPPAIRVIPNPIPAKVENFVAVERARRKAEDKVMMERFFMGFRNNGPSASVAGNIGSETPVGGKTGSGTSAGGEAESGTSGGENSGTGDTGNGCVEIKNTGSGTSVAGTTENGTTGSEAAGTENVVGGNPITGIPTEPSCGVHSVPKQPLTKPDSVLKDLLKPRLSGEADATVEKPVEKKFVEEGLMQQLMTMIFQRKPSAENIQVKDALLEHMGKSPSVPAEVKVCAQKQTEKLFKDEKDRQVMDKFMNYVFQEKNPAGKPSGGETEKPSSRPSSSLLAGLPVTPTNQASQPASSKLQEEPQRMNEFELNDMVRTAANEMLGGTASTASSPGALKKTPFHNASLASPVTPDTPEVSAIDITADLNNVNRKCETGGGDQSVSSSTPEIRIPELGAPTPTPQKPTMPALFLQGLLRLRLQIKQFEEKARRPLGYARKMYAGGTNPHVNKVIWITAAMQVMEDVMSEVDREIGRRSEGISMTPNKDIGDFAVQTFDILMRSAKWIVCGSYHADLITFTHQTFVHKETKFFPMHNDMPRQFDGRQTAPTNAVWRHPQWMEHTKGILKVAYGHPERVDLTYKHLAALRTLI